MKPVLLGPLDTAQNMARAIRELGDRVTEVQDLMISTGLAGQVLSSPQVVFVKNDGRWYKASSAQIETAPVTGYGITLNHAQTNTPVRVQVGAVVDGLDGLVPGETYYLGTDGALTLSYDGPVVVAMGIALSTKSLLLQPEYIGDL